MRSAPPYVSGYAVSCLSLRLRRALMAGVALALGALAPEAADTNVFAQRGYYITFMRMPTFGLAEWQRAADLMREDGANLLLLWVGGAFRSAKFPITWKYNEEHLNVRQDFVRELIDHAHARGIRVLLGFTPFGYDGVNQYPLEHPELQARQRSGEPVGEFGIHAWGHNLCPARAESQRFMLEYAREMSFDFYPNADGLMVESSDYAVCHCPECGDRFFDHEFRFVEQISREWWARKPGATIVVYPHYFSGAPVPGLDARSASHPFDPRWTLFFTPHSTRLDTNLLRQAKSSLYWSDAPALGGPEQIRAGAQFAKRYGFTGYVPSLEAYSYVATRPEEGQAYLVGRRQVPLGYGWLPVGQLPYGELPQRINRLAYREFSRAPDLPMDEFNRRLGQALFGNAATPQQISDALELHRVFGMEHSWSQAAPLAAPERVRAMKQRGELTPARLRAYRQALAGVRDIAARQREATGTVAREMRRIAAWVLAQWEGENASLLDLPESQLQVRMSWGHQSAAGTAFYVKFLADEAAIGAAAPLELEAGDGFRDGAWQTHAGAGEVDGISLTLRYAEEPVKPITNLHSIWAHLLANADADTARRLQLDPGCRPDKRKLTVQMDPEGTRGFSVTVDQLLTNRVFWAPALDVFLCAGEPPVSFAAHQRALQPFAGQRVLDQVEREPEAAYEQFASKWEDMGSPAYRNPAAPPPGHIVCVSWEGALHKFGIDRGAGVWNDLGNEDRFRFWFDFGELAELTPQTWRGQRLAQGLPVITTTIEKEGVRYEVEQFAHPLDGPPPERRGDLPMVLFQKVRLRSLSGEAKSVALRLTHQRLLPTAPPTSVQLVTNGAAWLLEDVAARRALLCLEGAGLSLQSFSAQGAGTITNTIVAAIVAPAGGALEFVVKLPSPVVSAADRAKLVALDYGACRAETLAFWSERLAEGAQFVVPEDAVNELFRASLWHALRLPRRHGGAGADVTSDLPYSNFAYDQTGTPWPVNQSVYVDYMIYDLRGYHDVAAEELALMFRQNQEPNGHIKGVANWGVYTPGLIYAVAQHYLLSGDRAGLEALLPQTLKALHWCLAEMRQAAAQTGPARGLILAPLNDLSHEARAWAFNQAYFFAGVDLLGRALADIGHPRAAECRAAASAMRAAVERGFAQAATAAPLVQLRDHTWTPFVPGDALTPRRLLEVWYPTDVDTGPLHLARLQALDPNGPLTASLLHDHEDNLYFKGWGMANEPVYNPQATVYLLRDEAKPAIRAFYSMMACAFSHSVFEPVEHRWGWGQYFGPPSTDGAWFELYRRLLIQERDDGTLLLLPATPRKWLEEGKQIRVARAPTYYGPLSFTVQSEAGAAGLGATVAVPNRQRPKELLVRLRHPRGLPLRSVTVNGEGWREFDTAKEWVRVPNPSAASYTIRARY